MTVADRVQQLRRKMGFSQAELARQAGLTTAAISQYESGVRTPNFEAIIKLSSALGVTADYLLTGEDSHSRTATSEERLFLRILESMTPEYRELVLQYALSLLDPPLVQLGLPLFYEPTQYAEYLFSQRAAGLLPVDVCGLVHGFGVEIITTELTDCEGMMVKEKNSIFLLNVKQHNPQRSRFTIALLLGHLILPWHGKRTYKVRSGSTFFTEDADEMEAVRFATHLLMPRGILARDIEQIPITLDELTTLATQKYEVSLFALLTALVELHPDRFAVIQSDGVEAIKVFQGTRPLVKNISPQSAAANLLVDRPQSRTVLRITIEESAWLIDGRPGVTLLEESVYDPEVGKILTLLIIEK